VVVSLHQHYKKLEKNSQWFYIYTSLNYLKLYMNIHDGFFFSLLQMQFFELLGV
jgi:hypothetical protein